MSKYESTASKLLGLEPAGLWEQFGMLSEIPRPSKKEQKVTEYLIDFATQHGLEYRLDAIENICIKVPATKGYEGAPTVILQAHSDMVTKKSDDSDFDFENDPIQLQVNNGWVSATDTR
jgi:dipeptidase D